MTDAISIVPSRREHLPGLIEVWRTAVRATHDFLAPADLVEIEKMVSTEYLPKTPVYVAVDNFGEPVAFMGLTGAVIDSLFVHARGRGRGLGRRLVEFAIAEAGPELIVEVNEQNTQAVAFYRALGFDVVDRFPLDGQGKPYPLLRLKRRAADVDGQLAIVPFVPAHANRLEAIRAAAFAPIFASFRALLGESIASVALANAEAEQQALLRSLCVAQADTKVFVAVSGDLVIGFVCAKLDRAQRVGEIVLDAVAPYEAGRGVGTALVEHALTHMRAEGMRVAVIGVGGDESHAPARRAYAKAGFLAGIPSVHLYRALEAAAPD